MDLTFTDEGTSPAFEGVWLGKQRLGSVTHLTNGKKLFMPVTKEGYNRPFEVYDTLEAMQAALVGNEDVRTLRETLPVGSKVWLSVHRTGMDDNGNSRVTLSVYGTEMHRGEPTIVYLTGLVRAVLPGTKWNKGKTAISFPGKAEDVVRALGIALYGDRSALDVRYL